MGHHNVVFPIDISYGSVSGWGREDGMVELKSGAVQVVSHGSDMRHILDVAWGIRGPADGIRLKEFHAARDGRANTFKYVDPLDMNTSSAPHVTGGGPGTPTGDDVVVVPDAAQNQATFQLIKRYPSGGIEHIRTIRHPAPAGDVMVHGKPAVAAPIIKVNGSAKTETTDYTIDYSTGIVTMGAGDLLAENDVVTAGFSFYERGRFFDKKIDVSISNYATISSRAPIPIVAEIQGVYHRDELDHGGGSTITGNASYAPAIHGTGVSLVLTAAATIIMPDSADFPIGGLPYATFRNSASGFSATFKDQAGATLWTIPSGGMVMAVCMQDATALWYGFKSA